MSEKPTHASGYTSEQVAIVRATCLYVASKLGDLMDEVVVVGGLVPSLLIDQEAEAQSTDLHVGTMDLDVGLALSLLNQKQYQAVAERLRRAGFERDCNENGVPTAQRWKLAEVGDATIDFLIAESLPDDRGGQLRHLEGDFAAIILPGLELAFLDREQITLSGRTIRNEVATRDIWCCGPGAYVVLKALAFDSRGENKDAYDLYYVLRYFRDGVGSIAERIRPFLKDPHTLKALRILRRDFLEVDSLGPRRVAEFLTTGQDVEIQADVAGFVDAFLRRCSLTR